MIDHRLEGAPPEQNAATYGLDGSIHRAFRRIAISHRDRTALVCGDRRISYDELDERAERMADVLQRHGVRHGDSVGLYTQRSPETIIAILGILKAGAAYVPFDSSYPQQLLQQIYRDSAPTLMLVDLADPSAQPPFWDGPAFAITSDSSNERPLLVARARPPAQASDLAYVMYTSGSTGIPKGVLVPHRAVLRLVLNNDFATLDANEVLLQLAPLSFDASTFEIWGALLNGGTLAILPAARPSLDDIAQAIERHQVTTMWLTAGLFHLMVDHRLDGLKPLRQLLAGGDVLSPAHVRKVLAALPHCRLINGYGPTENTTFSCCYTIPADPVPDGPIPIGKAILHTEIHILDEARRPVADGVAGELYVGGAGLADGYLHRPQLTAEKFVAHPFSSVPGARLYRTGDQVRKRADGNLEFLGRADRQVKINGKRVELDALEACLRRSALVSDAAVVCFAGADEQRRIAAFVTLTRAGPAAPDGLRSFLRRELPDYMMPAVLEVVDALPLGPTGKVDRTRLPVPAAVAGKPSAGSVSVPAASADIEAVLLRLWRQVLGAEHVGTGDNFFDLGGNSMQLIKVHVLLQSALGRTVPLMDLFEYPAIGALAARLGRQQPPQRTPMLTPGERAQLRNQALERSAPRQGTPS
jgi:amino acid adenylation domain-containing protein